MSLIMLVLTASFVDILGKQVWPRSSGSLARQSYVRRFFSHSWLSFSAYNNCSRLMTTNIPEGSIRCLYGLKVLSLIWVILAHSYLTLDIKAVGQLLQTQKVNSLFLFQVVLNASLAVESFFFISGLLVTLTVFRRLSRSPNMTTGQWVWFYIHRLVRTTPAVAVVIAIVLSAYQLSNGPLWREIIYPSAERCRKNWWIHLLHISNFFDVSRMCFLHLWYISADVQLFLLTPLVLYVLFKKPFFGRCLILCLILLSIVSTGVVTFMDHLPPTLIFDNPDPNSRKPFGNLILVKPYPHAAPYLIGVMTGYFLHQKPDFKLTKRSTLLGWCFSTMFILIALFITWQWNQGYPPSAFFGSLYAAFFRSLWAASMAWVVIACNSGKGGFIDTLLSWPIFIPMSRVSYTAYLIHPGLMYVFVASTRNLFMFSHFLVLYLFLSHLLATFLTSFILSLIIEIPFIRLEHMVHKYIFLTGNDEDLKSDNLPNKMEVKGRIGATVGKVYTLSPPRHRDLPSHNLSRSSITQHRQRKNKTSMDEMFPFCQISFSKMTSKLKVSQTESMTPKTLKKDRFIITPIVDGNCDEVVRL